MKECKVVIVGDTCDADYISSDILPSMFDDVVINTNKLAQGSPPVTRIKLIESLAKALQMHRETMHNWHREEFDTDKPTIETIINLGKVLMCGIDISTLVNYDEIHEILYEAVQDLLPYGEYGIHTIESIAYAPTETNYIFKK